MNHRIRHFLHGISYFYNARVYSIHHHANADSDAVGGGDDNKNDNNNNENIPKVRSSPN